MTPEVQPPDGDARSPDGDARSPDGDARPSGGGSAARRRPSVPHRPTHRPDARPADGQSQPSGRSGNGSAGHERPSLPARLRDNGADAAYSAGWTILRNLPGPWAHGLLGAVADVAWRRRTRGVRQLQRNLARVRPDLDEADLRALTRAGMRSYFRYWCEAFRLQDIPTDAILRTVVTHGEDAFWAAFDNGLGVVAALPHMGNWDFAGAWAHAHGKAVVAVAERVRPERLFDRFVAYREALGMEVVPATGGADPMVVLADRLRAGALVCLVSDRDLSTRGVDVTFFGERTRMPAGPAALAVRTGAALIPVTLWYDGPEMHIRFHDALEKPVGARQAIRTLTQQIADEFAVGIAEHPEDWHMLQRLWLADLAPGHRSALERSRAAR